MTIKSGANTKTIIDLIRSLIEDKGMSPEQAIREVEASFDFKISGFLKQQIKLNFNIKANHAD